MLKVRANVKLRNALVEKEEKLMKNINSSESIGTDQISANFLKNFFNPFIAIYLSEIISLSIKV